MGEARYLLGAHLGLLASLLLLSPSTGAGQTEDEESPKAGKEELVKLLDEDALARAETYSIKGVELYLEKKYEKALEEFLSAHEIVPSITNLYNIARCLDHLGRNKEAAEYYEKYIDNGGEKSDKAYSYLHKIMSVPTAMQIESTPAGAAVFIDDAKLMRGKTPFRTMIEPGKHVLEFKLPGYVGVIKEVMVPIDEETFIAAYMKEAPENEMVQPVWELLPETGTMGATADPSTTPSPHSLDKVQEGTGQPAAGGLQLQDEGRTHGVTALLLVGGGFSLPIRFEESGMFIDVAASLSLGVRKGLDLGIGLDAMMGGRTNIIGVQAHAGFEATVSRRFYIFGRMGIGALVIVIKASNMAIPEGNHADMYLRPELGIGWNIKGFNVRLSLASFTLNLGLTDYTAGPSGFYYPSVWLGYRF